MVNAWQIPSFCNILVARPRAQWNQAPPASRTCSSATQCGKDQRVDEATISEHLLRLMHRRRMPIQISDVFVLIPGSQDLHACKTVLLSPSPTSRHDLQCTDTLRCACTIYRKGHVELWVYYQRVGTPEVRWNNTCDDTCNCGNGANLNNVLVAMVLLEVHLKRQHWRVHVDPIRRRLEATQTNTTQDSIRAPSLRRCRPDPRHLFHNGRHGGQ